MKTATLMTFRRIYELIPRWVPTGAVSASIMYLTLVPRPLPDDMPELFPGADKVVHALMFGALAGAIVLDRRRGSDSLRWGRVALWSAVIASAAGGVIELLQGAMGMGREGDWMDFIADIIGAAIGAVIGGLTSEVLAKKPQ